MSAAVALWSAASVVQQAPRLIGAAHATLMAATPTAAAPSAAATAVPTAAPTSSAIPVPTAAATPVPTAAPSTTPSSTSSSGLDLPSVLLSAIVLATLAAALVVLFMPERTEEQRGRIRSIALAAAASSLFLTLLTLAQAISLGAAATPDQLHEENATWIGHFAFSVHYHMTADGLSLGLLTLSTVVFASVFVAAWKRHERVRLYCGLLLLLETSVNGTLCATDLVLFLLFFAMQAPALYMLVRCFGGAGRERAAARTGIALLAGASLVAVGFALVIAHAGVHSSDLSLISNATAPLSGASAGAAFWLITVGFLVTVFALPLHTWILDTGAVASSGVAAVFTGVVLRLSGYGLIRFTLGLFPAQSHRYSNVFLLLAVFSAVWGVLLACTQRSLRRLVVALSMGQMSLVLLAVGSPTTISLDGAVLQLVAGGFSSALLLLVCGAVEGRTRGVGIDRLGGLALQAPRLSAFWMVACLSAVGVPLLAGFSAEVMLFTGAFAVHPLATVLVLASTLVSAAVLLGAAQRVFLGPALEEHVRVRDVSALELGYLWPSVVFLVAFGVLAGRVVPVIGTAVTTITTALAGVK